jgi:hypothetical protein
MAASPAGSGAARAIPPAIAAAKNTIIARAIAHRPIKPAVADPAQLPPACPASYSFVSRQVAISGAWLAASRPA